MFENVNVGDRVRLTGHGEVHEVTVERRGPNYFSTGYNTFLDSEDWTVDILTPNEPTTNGTIVTLFDVAVERERTIVRTDGMWVDINAMYDRYRWDTWMDDAKPGSVKVGTPMSELEKLVQVWKRQYEAGASDVYWVCADALEKALADLPTFEIGD